MLPRQLIEESSPPPPGGVNQGGVPIAAAIAATALFRMSAGSKSGPDAALPPVH